MHLASVNSAEEQKSLEEHIQAYGKGHTQNTSYFNAVVRHGITFYFVTILP